MTGCIICPVRGNRPRRPREATLTCEPCEQWLWDTLVDVGDLAALLDELAVPGTSVVDGTRRKRGDPPAPARLDVLALLDHRGDVSILTLLESWARVVREERQLAKPTDPATILGELGVLRTHVRWIVGQPWVDELAKEIRTLHQGLQAVAGEPKARPVATCHMDVEGQECGGPIYASTWSDEAKCRKCGDVWPRERWQMLGRLQEDEAS